MRSILTNGLVIGSVYAAVAFGIVLVYNNSRVLNFAHGEIGMVGAFFSFALLTEQRWPRPVATVIGILASGAIGLAAYVMLRKLRASPLNMVMGSLAIAGLLQYAAIHTWGLNPRYVDPPIPGAKLSLFGLTFAGPRLLVLLVALATGAGLLLFFRYSTWSRVLRAAAEDPYAARLMGVNTELVSAATWAAAGALSGGAAILIAPLVNFHVLFMTLLFVRGLTAALLARMTSIGASVVAGLGIGIAEATLSRFTTAPGAPEAILVVLIVLLLALRPMGREPATDQGAPDQAPLAEPAPDRTARDVRSNESWTGRVLRRGRRALPVAVLLAAGALLPGRLFGEFGNGVLVAACITALVCVGLHLLVHWTGQVSLGQVAFVGLGAFATGQLNQRFGFPLPLAALGGIGAAVCGSAVVGIPALAIRGFPLAITTLAFGFAADRWLFRQTWLTGTATGVPLADSSFLGFDVTVSKELYIPTFLLLVVGAVAVARIGRTTLGRTFRMVAADEAVAASYGVNVGFYKFLGFLTAGAFAGAAGSVWVMSLGRVGATSFPPPLSLLYLAAVLQGGAGPVWGSLGAGFGLGMIAILGEHIGLSGYTELIGPVGILLVLSLYPGGLNELNRRNHQTLMRVVGPLRSGRTRAMARRETRTEIAIEMDAKERQ